MASQKGSDILLKIVSVVLAFSLWIYIINVENPIKTMRVYNVPVRLENTENIREQNLALLPNQEIMVTLTVRGPASEVYRSVASNFRVVANLEDLPLRAGINEVPIEITSYPQDLNITPSSNVKAVIYLDNYLEMDVPIVSQFDATPEMGYYVAGTSFNPASVTVRGPAQYVNQVKALAARGQRANLRENHREILALVAVNEEDQVVNHVSFSPVYVEMNIEVFATKSVPIVVQTEGELPEGYELIQTSVAPSTILIAGPSGILSQVNEIRTEELELTELTETSDHLMKLQIPEGIIAVEGTSSATVTVEVDEFETRTISKRVTTIGLLEGLEVELSANSINIVVSGSKSALEQITEESITAELDLTDLVAGEYELTPRIVLPVGIIEVSMDPGVLSVILRDPEEETPEEPSEEGPEEPGENP